MAFQDRTLTCNDCGQAFAFAAGEQEFYQQRGLLNEPVRCPTCRTARGSGGSPLARSEHQMRNVVCAQCGKETQVPFGPRGGRPVYCNDCFMKRSTSHGSSPKS